jgi:pyruvate formate lyase activating enzyme
MKHWKTVLIILPLAVISFLYLSALSRQPARQISSATPRSEEIKTMEAMYYDSLSDNKVQCQLCFRKCVIPEGKTGYCRVRENKEGKLYTLIYGQPSAVHLDPVEKEPQHHFLPGTDMLCLGTVGCNYKCRHCQNWHLSQARPGDLRVYDLPPEEVISMSKRMDVPTISFTYNDPVVMYEYLYDVAKLAKKEGLRILWHSNGSLNPEPLRELLRYTDAVTIDLKGFSDEAYRNSEAQLKPVLQSLKIIKESGVWLEIVYLVIPTVNDDITEIREMCRWLSANLGSDVPLHFSRFFPNYQLTHLSPTPVSKLETAFKIAKEEGINHVSIGNVPGHTNNSTFCVNCEEVVIQRRHFEVQEIKITAGRCDSCGEHIPGVWE